jgi:hypothetical protein
MIDGTRTVRALIVSFAALLAACEKDPTVVAADPFAPVPHEPNTVAYAPRERTLRAGLEALRVETEELDANERSWRAIHTWTWPSKLRVERRPSGGSVAQYAFVHRRGADVWLRAPLERHSRVATDAECHAVALEDGLRTAALLWPDGDTWTIEDGVARAFASDALLDGVVFEAELDANGRPMRIEARGGAHREGAAVDCGGWGEFEGRAVPCEFTFAIGGLVWSESVTKFVACSPFADVYFAPVELARSAAAPTSVAQGEVLAIDALPRGACRREPLAPATELDAALRVARERAAELAGDGVPADVLVELAADGSAAALVVRLAEGAPPLESFDVPPPRRALSVRLDATTPAAVAAARARLAAALPIGARTDAPYVWSGADGIHLVQPRP